MSGVITFTLALKDCIEAVRLNFVDEMTGSTLTGVEIWNFSTSLMLLSAQYETRSPTCAFLILKGFFGVL
jgi:hypothetical protein